MHVLTVLEPYSSTSIGNVGNLFQYIYWHCWIPIPVHRLAMLKPCPNAYIDNLESIGNVGTLFLSYINSFGTIFQYIYWQCWNPIPIYCIDNTFDSLGKPSASVAACKTEDLILSQEPTDALFSSHSSH